MIELLANIGRWGWFVHVLLAALSEGLDFGELFIAIIMIGYLGGWIWWMVITITLAFISGFFQK